MKRVCSLLFVIFLLVAICGAWAAIETQSRADAIAAEKAKEKDSGFASVFVMMIATSRLHYLWSFTWGSATVAAVLFGALVVSDALAHVVTLPAPPSMCDLADSIARAIAATSKNVAFEMPPSSVDEALARLRTEYSIATPPIRPIAKGTPLK